MEAHGAVVPAVADPTTAMLVAATTRYITVFLLASAVFSVIGFYFIVTMPWPDQVTPFGIWLILMTAGLVWLTASFAPLGMWLLKGKHLLAEQQWRSVPAVVVRSRSFAREGVVEITDGDRVRQLWVTSLLEPIQQVINKSGRVRLVGPNSQRWVAARVDGLHSPLPGRQLRTKIAPRPLRVFAAREPTGTAADDQVAASMAERGRRTYLIVAGVVAVILPFPLYVTAVRTQPPSLVVIIPIVVAILLAALLLWTSRTFPKLLRNGPWTRVDVRLNPWQTRRSGLANASATATLAGGETMAVTLRNAHVDLLGTMWETGSVWVAGEPAAGRTFAVGFPGYPVLGTARFD